MPRAKHPLSPEHIAEMERRRVRRFERDCAALGAGNMNDTKWHEVIQLLASRNGSGLKYRMKMVGSDRVWDDDDFYPFNRRWTDSSGGPFEHREVEWLEITGDSVAEIVEALGDVGSLPIVAIADGIRLIAYGSIDGPCTEAAVGTERGRL